MILLSSIYTETEKLRCGAYEVSVSRGLTLIHGAGSLDQDLPHSNDLRFFIGWLKLSPSVLADVKDMDQLIFRDSACHLGRESTSVV